MSDGKITVNLPKLMMLAIEDLTLRQSILASEERLLDNRTKVLQERRNLLRGEENELRMRVEAAIGQELGNRNIRLMDRETGLCEIE